MKIALVTLGCDKNTVDAEYLAGVLAARGHEVVSEGEHGQLDVLVLFTCGFIDAARSESVQTILAFCDAKERLGNPRNLMMAGCLSQRFGEEMGDELPGVDAFAGVGRPEELADLVEEVARNDGNATGKTPVAFAPASPSMTMDHAVPRMRLDSGPVAYLKIADGCDHACAFCAIPAMKGPYASVPREILIEEARELLASGARELNLIAQDLAPYGRDLYDDYRLPDLLEDLCRIEGDFWLRLLYFYPSGLTERFLEVFAREDKICKYLDIPLQHLDAGVLKAMRRPSGSDDAAEAIARLRQAVPDVVVRTTVIVGFPGETSAAFKSLLASAQRIGFECLGCFVFSPEEGTPAAEMPGQIDPEAAERRRDRLMRTQAKVSAKIQNKLLGRRLRVLIESVNDDGTEARGRSYREAPDIDGEVIVRAEDGSGLKGIEAGRFVEVEVTDADAYDLAARLL